ncbi:MAG TPA: arginine deiminase-related protein [Gemmatimonadaceae bacterium]|nr:arginine deiminase-related protein [Gemmatimonadaceae bacterium]
MLIALTRDVSPAIASCELTHLARAPIDVERARAEHRAYERSLAEAGCAVERVEPAPELPDSVFIEDAAVVLDELAVVTRPGAESRRAETPAVAAALGRHRAVVRQIEPPGTLDGGDVLVVGRRAFVGRSGRSNRAGIEQLRRILGEYGYEVRAVPTRGCLHLKSAVTRVGEALLLINREWAPSEAFSRLGLTLLDVHPDEPFAANALRVNGTVIYPAAFPRTADLLDHRGVRLSTVEAGELAKAEGAVTCCSLVFAARNTLSG